MKKDPSKEYFNKKWMKVMQQMNSEKSLENFSTYTDLFVKWNILILADIFENFRDVCLKTMD